MPADFPNYKLYEFFLWIFILLRYYLYIITKAFLTLKVLWLYLNFFYSTFLHSKETMNKPGVYENLDISCTYQSCWTWMKKYCAPNVLYFTWVYWITDYFKGWNEILATQRCSEMSSLHNCLYFGKHLHKLRLKRKGERKGGREEGVWRQEIFPR